jgi:hypothetical protein
LSLIMPQLALEDLRHTFWNSVPGIIGVVHAWKCDLGETAERTRDIHALLMLRHLRDCDRVRGAKCQLARAGLVVCMELVPELDGLDGGCFGRSRD